MPRSRSMLAPFRSRALRFALPLLASFAAVLPVHALDTEGRGYFREPSLRGDTVVFVAEGDLWSVPAAGGTARRLTSHPGIERRPKLSPDGAWIAFDATYEGPGEIYLMPADGGLPRRLTWHGAPGRAGARMVGWTPDGRIAYATQAYATLPETQLVLLDPETGHPERVPLAQAADGVWSGDGHLWFVRFPFQGSHAKRYRGGTVEQLWFWRPDMDEAEPWGDAYPGTRKAPMLAGDRVVFLSDVDGTMNLRSAARDGSDERALTAHVGWDIKEAENDGARIVYRLGADLRLLDTDSGESRVLPIRLASDFDQLRERWIDEPMRWLSAAHLSPDGDRVALTSRGEVFVFPTGKDGRRVRATRDPGARFRSARFLDADTLVALTDASGEVEWWTMPANGLGERRRITDGGASLRFDGIPSPDGRWIAHHDRANELLLTRLADGTTRKLAESQWGFSNPVWSPDSRWLAYVNAGENQLSRVFLHHVDRDETLAATSDRYDSYSPAFSIDGKWLWFLSDRRFRSEVGSPWGSRQPDPYFDEQTEIFALALDADARFPFDPKHELDPEDEPGEDDDEDASKDAGRDRKKDRKRTKDGEQGNDDGGEKKKVEVAIDADGLGARLYKVPAGHGTRRALSTDGKRLFWIEDDELQTLKIERHAEVEAVAKPVSGYELSADGKKLLLRSGDALHLVDPAPKAELGGDSKIDLDGWTFPVDPDEEFRQMFLDAWRLHRDYFYDPNMHGVDWDKMRTRYEPLLDRVTDRDEVADVQAMLISELSALHASVSPGDPRRTEDPVDGASLGARFEPVEGGWRIAHVYRSDPDLPDEVSPLARPGVDARVGDVLVSIDGLALADTPPGRALRNKAGRDVRLTLRRDGKTHDVIVRPISTGRARDLRYDEWEYTRRLETESKSDGAIGYVHLRAMGRSNIAEWYREFYPVFTRQGLILDVRHNRGGNIDSWILGKLLRREWMYWQGRTGRPYWNMQAAFRGHMVVLVNAWTASDGEAFADGFRRLGLGPVIGERTWGGEIWLTSSNRQVDGGIARAAEFGVYKDGEWLIEGVGVIPDIVVVNAPHATFEGRDAQLDAAIEYLKTRIAEDPRPVEPPPPYPDKSAPDNR